MTGIILMSDPKVAAVPVEERGEPLVDVRSCDVLLVDARRRDDAGAFALVRESVLSRLLDAQRRLPPGLRLLFVEGYRPPALQRRYFERYADRLREENPDWAAQSLREAASRYVSPPEIAPHSAGAAVDLTLATDDGHELDMGTPVNASPEQSDNACYTHAANVPTTARSHRDTLCTALTAAGLVNYPTEWWH